MSIDDLSSVQHSARNLKGYLTSVIFIQNQIDFSFVLAVVIDTPHVMEKTKSDIHNDFKNIIPLKCVLHILNLATKDIAHLQISCKIIRSNLNIANYFKSSYLLLSCIKSYQQSDNIKHNLQIFTETRCYSLSKLCLCVNTYKNAFQLAVAMLNIDNIERHDIINDEIHYIKYKCLLDLNQTNCR